MISAYGTIAIAILVLYLGRFINRKVGFLRKYYIPEPVTGGILASLVSAIAFSMGIGLALGEVLDQFNAFLPPFVCGLFGGILYTNLAPALGKKLKIKNPPEADNVSISRISDISRAYPILLLLIGQLVVIILYAVFVVCRLMGKDYDAAVIAGGYLGLGLGTTSTTMANMTAITERYGGSAKAFLVTPLMGAFFIDNSNSLINSVISQSPIKAF